MTGRIQLLDDLGAEFARVAAQTERAPRRRVGLRPAAIALSIAVLLAGGAYSVPATRAAVDGIADSFASWVSGDDSDVPGRALRPEDSPPSWFRGDGETRLIAETAGVGLYARRVDSDEGPRLEIGLGGGIVMSGTLENWQERLVRHAVVVLGPALFGPRDVLDEHGRFPLIGVTTRSIKRVELRYSEGPPIAGDTGDGGFVLLADAWRAPRELIVYDGAGRLRERVDMRSDDPRYLCKKEPGTCP